MHGDLVETTAADVCRELASHGASGILAIDGPGGPGRVVFQEGRIVAAVSPTPRARLGDRLVGAGELDPDDLATALAAQQEEGETARLGSLLVERGMVRRDAVRVFVQEQVLDALFEIVRWRYGGFSFKDDEPELGQGVPLSLSVDDALVEVARRQQEWDQLSQVIPDLEAVPSFRSGAATASASLEPDEFAVLASVDGVRTVRALAADLGYGEFEAARIVYGLTLLGIVDVELPQDEIGAALDNALGLGEVVPADSGLDVPAADVEEEPEVWVHSGEEPQEPADGPTDQEPAAQDHGVEDPLPHLIDLEFEVDTAAGESQEPAEPPAASEHTPTEPAPGPSILPPPPPEAAGATPPAHAPAPQHDPASDEEPGISTESDGTSDQFASTDQPTSDMPEPEVGERAPEPGSRADGPAPGADAPATDAEVADHDDGERPDTGEPPGVEDAPPPPPRSAPQRGDDNDVSEFLRELSRLSLDPPDPSGARPRPGPPPSQPSGSAGSSGSSGAGSSPSSTSGSSKKKRRGLFGRG